MAHRCCWNMRMATFSGDFMWIWRAWRFGLFSLRRRGNFYITNLLAVMELSSAAYGLEHI